MAALPEKGLSITKSFPSEFYAQTMVDEYKAHEWITHGPEKIEREL